MKWSIPAKVVEEGRQLQEEGRVTAITQNPAENQWNGEVLADQLYHVKLDGSPKEQDECSCHYWQEKGYCPHTVALELALRAKGIQRNTAQQPTHLVKTYQPPSLAMLLTKSLQKVQQEQLNQPVIPDKRLRVALQFERVLLSNYQTEKMVLALRVKIGYQTGRLYLVKNIFRFFQQLEKGGCYELNKQETISLVVQQFDHKDWQLLQKCLAVYRDYQALLDQSLTSKLPIDQRYLPLPVSQTRKWLEQLGHEETWQLLVEDERFTAVTFADSARPPFHFDLTPQAAGEVAVRFNHQPHEFWELYHWIFCQGVLYPLTQEQQKIYGTFRQISKRMTGDILVFSSQQVNDLFNLVVPAFKKIGTVTIATDLAEKLVSPPLQVHFQLDYKKEWLSLQIVYQYGEMKINPLDSTKDLAKNHLLIRDNTREQQVQQLVTQLGFSRQQSDYQRVLTSTDDLYYFLHHQVGLLAELGQVQLSNNLQRINLDPSDYQPEISVVDQDSWLTVRFDVSNIAETEVDQVLTSLLAKKKYHQFANGRILSLEGEQFGQLEEVLQALEPTIEQPKQQQTVPLYRALQIEEAMQPYKAVTYNFAFQRMVRLLTDPTERNYQLPTSLKAQLRPYQIDGFQWLKMLSTYGFGGILADDMGLGKTVQTLAYLASQREDGETGPTLIICPASLIYNWEQECAKFVPTICRKVVSGSKEERAAQIADWQPGDIFIASYASVRQDYVNYQAVPLSSLILDEAQAVKNTGTKTFQAIKQLPSKQRFALSGTPIENNVAELWAIFDLIMPGFFPSKSTFTKMSPQTIAKQIQPFVLRREKKNVLKDLPLKIDSNIYSPLTEDQKKLYLAQLKHMQQTVNQMDSRTFQENRLSILAGLTRLRQICCDPHLFMAEYQGQSGKLLQLLELVKIAQENGRRLLIFSQFTSMLDIIQTELKQLDLAVFYLRGSTPAKERMEMVERFNEGERDVFLISLKAGGTGLNLTGADTVILYDLWWNPAVEEQAASRAHRIGQQKVVEVWHMIAKGTIEERMHQLQQEKKALFDQVLGAGEAQQLAKLTEADIRDLLAGAQ